MSKKRTTAPKTKIYNHPKISKYFPTGYYGNTLDDDDSTSGEVSVPSYDSGDAGGDGGGGMGEGKKLLLDEEQDNKFFNQLVKGTIEELEHAEGKLDKGDIKKAMKIAMDHLEEDDEYYTKLEKCMECGDKKLDEKFESKKQQKYFYSMKNKTCKDNPDSKECEKWTKLTDEFTKKTKDFKKLPQVKESKEYNKSSTFSDYPKSATNAAKKALRWKEKYGDEVKGGTKTGWQRANQLANRESISFSTVKRIKAFFDRHEKNFNVNQKHKGEPWKDNGYVAGLIWGMTNSDSKEKNAIYNWAVRIIKKVEGKKNERRELIKNIIKESLTKK